MYTCMQINVCIHACIHVCIQVFAPHISLKLRMYIHAVKTFACMHWVLYPKYPFLLEIRLCACMHAYTKYAAYKSSLGFCMYNTIQVKIQEYMHTQHIYIHTLTHTFSGVSCPCVRQSHSRYHWWPGNTRRPEQVRVQRAFMQRPSYVYNDNIRVYIRCTLCARVPQ